MCFFVFGKTPQVIYYLKKWRRGIIMAKYVLTSYIHSCDKDENGVRYPIVMKNPYGLIDLIKNNIGDRKRVVIVANDPMDIEINNEKGSSFFRSLEMSGMAFEENIMLDCRNEGNAKEIILGADFVMLAGGRILRQKEFFERIHLKELLEVSNALVLGMSAGAMNMCETIFNFPEDWESLEEERVVGGMGICDRILIPHYDCSSDNYILDCEGIDVMQDYIYPFSHEKQLLGLGNDSYITIFDGEEKIFGDYVIIQNGEVVERRLCQS